MKVTTFKMKYFGKMVTLFRVVDAKGEVIQVSETQEEAQAWIEAQE